MLPLAADLAACDTAAVAFHESFWLATSAAAPVITLAAVVALPDSSTASRVLFGLSAIAAFRRHEAEVRKRSTESRVETSTSSLLEVVERLAQPSEKMDVQPTDLRGLVREARDAVRGGDDEVRARRLYKSAKVNWRISFGNVIIQAGLLAVSLAALAYDEDVVPPWVAVVLAVGGILLLAWTSVAGRLIRAQWENWEFDPSSDSPPESPISAEDLGAGGH